MRSAAGVFERPTLLVRPMYTSTFVFSCFLTKYTNRYVYKPGLTCYYTYRYVY